MGGSNVFDQIEQSIREQIQLMEELRKENRKLRSQLEALRSGHGLVITIGNTRFEPQNQVAAVAATTTVPNQAPTQTISEAPTTTLPELSEVNIPTLEEQQLTQQVATPTFLEEIMIDEFSTAMTNPATVEARPEPTKSAGPERPAHMDEKQKAILRRELMGSFLLE